MPGNDVTGSHSSVRTTTKQCSGNPRQLLSKCQRQPGPKSLKGTKLEDFVLYLSRPHFPQALPGTWQQVTWQPSPCKMASGIISENRWMHFFKASCISPHPPPPPYPAPPPQPRDWRKRYCLRAALLSSAALWPSSEPQRGTWKSAAQLQGKSRYGKGWTPLLVLPSKRTQRVLVTIQNVLLLNRSPSQKILPLLQRKISGLRLWVLFCSEQQLG